MRRDGGEGDRSEEEMEEVRERSVGKVGEPDGAVSGTGMDSMTTQTRTLSYNMGGQLLSVMHPESGTVSYTNSMDGLTLQKIDAKGQRVDREYTANGQPGFVRKFMGAADSMGDLCPKGSYQDRAQSVDGGFSGSNGQGRMAAISTGCSSCGGL